SRSSSTLRLFDVRLERQELPAPELLCLFQPGLQLVDWFRGQPVNPHARVQPSVLFGNETAGSERSQMAAHSRGADAREPRKLSGWLRSLPQKLDHLPSLRVGQRGQRAIQSRLPGGRLCGSPPSHFRFGTSAIDLRYLSPVWSSNSASETSFTLCLKFQT